MGQSACPELHVHWRHESENLDRNDGCEPGHDRGDALHTGELPHPELADLADILVPVLPAKTEKTTSFPQVSILYSNLFDKYFFQLEQKCFSYQIGIWLPNRINSTSSPDNDVYTNRGKTSAHNASSSASVSAWKITVSNKTCWGVCHHMVAIFNAKITKIIWGRDYDLHVCQIWRKLDYKYRL